MNSIPQIRCTHACQKVAEQGSLKVDAPETVTELWREHIASSAWFDECKETLIVFALNTRYRLLGWNLVSIGSLNETLANPREIFRPLIQVAAGAFVLAHNHPSGDPSPSASDRALTDRLNACAELLQIKFLDHVIVGSASQFSLMHETHEPAPRMKRPRAKPKFRVLKNPPPVPAVADVPGDAPPAC